MFHHQNHMMRDCPNKCVLIIRDDGGYSSASDFDDETYALLATDSVGHDESDHEEEHVGTEDAESI